MGTVLLVCASVGMLGLSTPAVAAATSSGTLVKAYAAILNGSQLNLSPLDVQATSDGRSIALAETQSPKGLGWTGWSSSPPPVFPQRQEEVGCVSPQGAGD